MYLLFLRNVGLPMAIWYVAWLALALAIGAWTPLNALVGMMIGHALTGTIIVAVWVHRRRHRRGT